VGRFIWDYEGEWPDAELPRHYFTRFRRTFELDDDVESALAHIAVADKYILYVNGEYVGRGPARSVGPWWTPYDTLEIGPKLVKGKNVIAVLAYYYGNDNGFSVDQCPGFFAQVELKLAGGVERVIGTDGQWQTLPLKAYRPDVELVSRFEGQLTEVYDARLADPGWILPEYDDSDWRAASVLWPTSNRHSCWSYLEPRATPNLRERRISPERILKTGEARAVPKSALRPILADVQVAERLQLEQHFPLELTRLEKAEALLTKGGGEAIFQSSQYFEAESSGAAHGERDPFVILDFGRPIFGRPAIQFDAPEGAVVELAWSCRLLDGRVPAVNEITRGRRNAASCVARKGPQTWQMFEGNTFRYLMVVFRNPPMVRSPGLPIRHQPAREENARPIKVKCIDVVCFEYPVVRKGRFECSDETLTKLWRTGVDAVYLHMEDTFVMDAERERMLYLLAGEMLQSHWIIQAAYGDLALTDNHFRQTARMQQPNGLLPGYLHGKAPSGFPPSGRPFASKNWLWLAGYFSTLFGHAVADRYRYTGRMAFLEEHYPALVRIAQWCSEHQDGNGLLYNLPGTGWFDHIENETAGANLEYNAVYYKMLLDVVEAAGLLGYERDERKWRKRSERVLRSLRELHWNAEIGLFADSVVDGCQSPLFTETSNAMALSYGIATPEQAKRILYRLTDVADASEERVPKPGDFNIRRSYRDCAAVLSCASPLYIYYVIRGLTDAGHGDHAVKHMSERFEAMMSGDSPSFQECWLDPRGGVSGHDGSSLHTGGGGLISFLSTEVLGISHAEPAFQRCRIKPLCSHLTWANGAMPTPHGNIEVAWEKEAGEFRLSADIPNGMPTDIVFPVDAGELAELVHNGKAFSSDDLGETDGKVSVSVDGGKHQFVLRRASVRDAL
jgi:hypothetical protein